MEGAKVGVSARTVEASDHFLPGTNKQCVADIEAAVVEVASARVLAGMDEVRLYPQGLEGPMVVWPVPGGVPAWALRRTIRRKYIKARSFKARPGGAAMIVQR